MISVHIFRVACFVLATLVSGVAVAQNPPICDCQPSTVGSDCDICSCLDFENGLRMVLDCPGVAVGGPDDGGGGALSNDDHFVAFANRQRPCVISARGTVYCCTDATCVRVSPGAAPVNGSEAERNAAAARNARAARFLRQHTDRGFRMAERVHIETAPPQPPPGEVVEHVPGAIRGPAFNLARQADTEPAVSDMLDAAAADADAFSDVVETSGIDPLVCAPEALGEPTAAQSCAPGDTCADEIARATDFVESRGSDPVDPVSGEFRAEWNDLVLPGIGLDLVLTRTYGSRWSYRGPLGWGWSHAYNQRLISAPDEQGALLWRTGRASVVRFSRVGDDYAARSSSYQLHRRRDEAGWVLTRRDGVRSLFDAHGFLEFIVDLDGNRQAFVWQARPGVVEPRLVQVVDSVGRRVDFEYDTGGDLERIVVRGTEVELGYDVDKRGDLVLARRADGRGERYGYRHIKEEPGDEPFLATYRVEPTCRDACTARSGCDDVVERVAFDCRTDCVVGCWHEQCESGCPETCASSVGLDPCVDGCVDGHFDGVCGERKNRCRRAVAWQCRRLCDIECNPDASMSSCHGGRACGESAITHCEQCSESDFCGLQPELPMGAAICDHGCREEKIVRDGACNAVEAECLTAGSTICQAECSGACEGDCRETCGLGCVDTCHRACGAAAADAREVCDTSCVDHCVADHRDADDAPQYGRRADLGHNLTTVAAERPHRGADVVGDIDDHPTWLWNVYEEDPSSPGFDRVVAQWVGAGPDEADPTTTYAWYDLRVEDAPPIPVTDRDLVEADPRALSICERVPMCPKHDARHETWIRVAPGRYAVARGGRGETWGKTQHRSDTHSVRARWPVTTVGLRDGRPWFEIRPVGTDWRKGLIVDPPDALPAKGLYIETPDGALFIGRTSGLVRRRFGGRIVTRALGRAASSSGGNDSGAYAKGLDAAGMDAVFADGALSVFRADDGWIATPGPLVGAVEVDGRCGDAIALERAADGAITAWPPAACRGTVRVRGVARRDDASDRMLIDPLDGEWTFAADDDGRWRHTGSAPTPVDVATGRPTWPGWDCGGKLPIVPGRTAPLPIDPPRPVVGLPERACDDPGCRPMDAGVDPEAAARLAYTPDPRPPAVPFDPICWFGPPVRGPVVHDTPGQCDFAYVTPHPADEEPLVRVAVIRDPRGEAWVVYADAHGRMRRHEHAGGRVRVDDDYDAAGRLIGTRTAFGDRVCIARDAAGQVIAETHLPASDRPAAPERAARRFGWTAHARLAAIGTSILRLERGDPVIPGVFDPDADRLHHDDRVTWTGDWDAAGHLIAEQVYSVDGEPPLVTLRDYDPRGRLARTETWTGAWSELDYDPSSGRWSARRSGGPNLDPVEITVVRDALGRPVERRGDGRPTEWLEWNLASDLETRTVQLDADLPPFTTGYGYDAVGRLARIEGPLTVVERQYGDGGSLESETVRDRAGDEAPRTTRWTRNASGAVVDVEHPEGNRVRYCRDARDAVVRIQAGRWPDPPVGWNGDCDDPGLPIGYADAVETVRVFVRDVDGAVSNEAAGELTTMTFVRDGHARIIESSVGAPCTFDGRGRARACVPGAGTGLRTRWAFDADGRLAWRARLRADTLDVPARAEDWRPANDDPALAALSAFGYDDAGRPTWREAEWFVDRDGARDVLGAIRTERTRDDHRGVDVTVDPLGRATTAALDAWGRPNVVTTPSGLDLTFDHGSDGRSTTTVRRAARREGASQSLRERTEYTDFGAIERVWNPKTGFVHYEAAFDRYGRQLWARTPARARAFRHGAFGEIIEIHRLPLDAGADALPEASPDAVGELEQRATYDRNGRRTVLADTRGVTQIEWDDLDRPVRWIFPDGTSAEQGYVPGTGAIAWSRDRRGAELWRRYDGAGRLARLEARDPRGSEYDAVRTFEYRATGLVRARTEGPGGDVEIEFERDATGRIVGESTHIGDASAAGWSPRGVELDRDASGALRAMHLAELDGRPGRPGRFDDSVFLFDDDDERRLQKITWLDDGEARERVDVAWAGFGPPVALDFGDSLHLDRTFDDEVRVDHVGLRVPGDERLALDLARDRRGLVNRLDRTDAEGDRATTRYTHDAYGRVATDTSETRDRTWVYDDANDWIAVDDPVAGLRVRPETGDDHRLLDFDGPVDTDADGRILRHHRSSGAAGAGGRVFTYDAFGDLVGATTDDAEYQFTYDPFGRLVAWRRETAARPLPFNPEPIDDVVALGPDHALVLAAGARLKVYDLATPEADPDHHFLPPGSVIAGYLGGDPASVNTGPAPHVVLRYVLGAGGDLRAHGKRITGPHDRAVVVDAATDDDILAVLVRFPDRGEHRIRRYTFDGASFELAGESDPLPVPADRLAWSEHHRRAGVLTPEQEAYVFDFELQIDGVALTPRHFLVPRAIDPVDLAFTPDGDLVVSGADDGLRYADLDTTDPTRHRTAHAGRATATPGAPDDGVHATLAGDPTRRVERTRLEYAAGLLVRARATDPRDGREHDLLYISGPSGLPVGAITDRGDRYFFHRGPADRLDTVFDAGGDAIARYDYDAFGTPEAHHETPPSGPELLHAGQPYLADLGLQRLGARWYAPGIGRFLTPDPAGFVDGPNRFAYVGNQPTAFVDPFGLYAQPIGRGAFRVHRPPSLLDELGDSAARQWGRARDGIEGTAETAAALTVYVATREGWGTGSLPAEALYASASDVARLSTALDTIVDDPTLVYDGAVDATAHRIGCIAAGDPDCIGDTVFDGSSLLLSLATGRLTAVSHRGPHIGASGRRGSGRTNHINPSNRRDNCIAGVCAVVRNKQNRAGTDFETADDIERTFGWVGRSRQIQTAEALDYIEDAVSGRVSRSPSTFMSDNSPTGHYAIIAGRPNARAHVVYGRITPNGRRAIYDPQRGQSLSWEDLVRRYGGAVAHRIIED